MSPSQRHRVRIAANDLAEAEMLMAERVVGQNAHNILIFDAAIDLLQAKRDFEATEAAIKLCALTDKHGNRFASSSKIIPGYIAETQPHRMTLCTCCHLSPFACRNIETEAVTTHSAGMKLVLKPPR